MPRIPFDELPDSARVWVFPANRTLEDDEREELLEAVDRFLESWNAHGAPLRGARDFRHDRFLIVGVDEESAPPSGCSIDALVRVFKEMEPALDVRLLDRAPIWYRQNGEIHCVSRVEFRDHARTDQVGPDTVVYDPAVTRMTEIRTGRWSAKAKESWHAKLL